MHQDLIPVTPFLPSQPRITQGAKEVVARLDEVGLPPLPILTEVMEVVQSADAEWTPHHPRTYRSGKIWGDAIGVLRYLLKPLGWSNDEPRNQPLVVAPSGHLAVTIANADAATGTTGPPYPRTKAAKGKRTRDAIHQNQVSFFDLRPDLAPQGARSTWFLLVHVDSMTGEVRAELSLPVDIHQDGHVSWWQERIILPSLDGTIPSSAMSISPDAGDSSSARIEVSVERRAV